MSDQVMKDGVGDYCPECDVSYEFRLDSDGEPLDVGYDCPYCRIAQLKAESAALREGLTALADGSTPWMDTDSTDREPWEIMASYAKQLLAALQETKKFGGLDMDWVEKDNE